MGTREQKGIIPRLCDQLFEWIASNKDDQLTHKVEVSYMEIYNEKVRDLLDPNGYEVYVMMNVFGRKRGRNQLEGWVISEDFILWSVRFPQLHLLVLILGACVPFLLFPFFHSSSSSFASTSSQRWPTSSSSLITPIVNNVLLLLHLPPPTS